MWIKYYSLLIVLFTGHSLFGQKLLMMSNGDFGSAKSIYLDSENYTRVVLEPELMRIKYHCALVLEELPPEPKPYVIQISGYDKEEIRTEGNKEKRISADYYLRIGKKHSVFLSKARHQSDSLFLAGGNHIKAGSSFNQKANALFAQDCYYVNITTRELSFTGRLAADDFQYEETLPKINWGIRDSVSTICGYPCQLAVGDFRGRTYRAWFTYEIPVPAGPWKLQGLPGLILWAEDEDHLLSLRAETVTTGVGNITKPKYPYIQVSRAQYAKLQEQYRRDSHLFSANHTSRSGWTPVITENHIPDPIPKYTIMETDLTR